MSSFETYLLDFYHPPAVSLQKYFDIQEDMNEKEKERKGLTPKEMEGNAKLDLEGPSLNKPLFRENDHDRDMEQCDNWSYESLF